MRKREFYKIFQKKIIIYFIIILFIGINILPSLNGTIVVKYSTNQSFATTFYVGGNGPNNYSSIQAAINDSFDGDTIFVYDDSSPYSENIVIGKSLTLIGEDKLSTIIDGNGLNDAIYISAAYVILEGFTIQNSGSTIWDACIELRSNFNQILDNIIQISGYNGINILMANNNLIANNQIISNENHGIFIQASNENTLQNNEVEYNNNTAVYIDNSDENLISNCYLNENDAGIIIISSNDNIVTNNNIISNNGDGISVDNSIYVQIFSNVVDSNSDNGIQLYHCDDIDIYENEILNNIEYGIFLQYYSTFNNIYDNTISNNLHGVALETNSNNNMINNNIINYNNRGSIILECKDNMIQENEISNNICGISFPFFETENIVIDNTIRDNTYGVRILLNSNNNFIYHNYFMDNNLNAYDESSNNWDDGYPSGGNYWDDYIGTDRDGDGIGDVPYDIDGGDNQDLFPLGFFTTPHQPTITGTTSGSVGVEYDYSFISIDPNDDDLFYYIDWDDNSIEEWIGPYESGERVVVSHNWSFRGTYVITAKVKDINDLESTWGSLEVSMPMNNIVSIIDLFQRIFEQIIERFPILHYLFH